MFARIILFFNYDILVEAKRYIKYSLTIGDSDFSKINGKYTLDRKRLKVSNFR